MEHALMTMARLASAGGHLHHCDAPGARGVSTASHRKILLPKACFEKMSCRSENILQSELQLAHLESGSGYKNGAAGHGVSNLPKVRRWFRAAATPERDRVSERGMVRSVERLETQLKALPLSDREILDCREIHGPNPRTRQRVARHVAELSGGHIREGCKIEPLVGASLVGREIRIDTRRVKPVLVSYDDLA